MLYQLSYTPVAVGPFKAAAMPVQGGIPRFMLFRGIGSQEAPGLPRPQARIQAVPRQELTMGALLDDPAAIHDDQSIHRSNGR